MSRRDPSVLDWLRPQPKAKSRADRIAQAHGTAPRTSLRDALGLRVKFERRGLNVQVTLVSQQDLEAHRSRHGADSKLAAPQPSADPTVVLMQTELRALLRLHPDSRNVLRHLGYLEQQLRKIGAKALTEPPAELLRTALAQLEMLVTQWDQRGLAELRSRLAVEIAQRNRAEDGPLHAAHRSNFLDDQRVEVTEVSELEFAQAQESWAMPLTAVKPAG